MKRFQSSLLAVFLSAAWACQPSTGSRGHRQPVGNEIVTVAGNGSAGYSGDGGPAVQAQLNQPFGVARGPDGHLYICDTGNHVIRRVASDGTIATVAGTGEAGYSGDGGPALEAGLNEPYEIRFDREGNILFVERANHVVRKGGSPDRPDFHPGGHGPGRARKASAETGGRRSRPGSTSPTASRSVPRGTSSSAISATIEFGWSLSRAAAS